MCKHKWLTTDYTYICSNCGLTTFYLSLDKYNKFSAPINRCYDRVTRFSTKIDKLLGMHSGPRAVDPVWALVHKNCKCTFTPTDIRRVLRFSNLKLKHYDCIRVFSDAFTDFKIQKFDVHAVRSVLLVKFKNIHRLWQMANIKQFFSYDFLIRKFLEDMHSPLIEYLKPTSNKHRLKKYNEKLVFISTQSYYRRWNRGSVRTRSQSD
jgi:hypothetical protein